MLKYLQKKSLELEKKSEKYRYIKVKQKQPLATR